MLFVPPPKAPVWTVALYGLLIGVGQFGLLFIAIQKGLPGRTCFARYSGAGVLHHFSRLGVLERRAAARAAPRRLRRLRRDGGHRLGTSGRREPWPFWAGDPGLTVLGFRQRAGEDGRQGRHVRFQAWSSLAAPLPLLLLSLAVDGPGALATLAHPSFSPIGSVLAVSYAGTVFGFGLWADCSRAIRPRPSLRSRMAPIVGMVAGSVVFGERMKAVELFGGVLGMAGLVLNILGDWLVRPRAAQSGD